jgi:Raf kinase inhibitor-like YbhB/YbcL family protein
MDATDFWKGLRQMRPARIALGWAAGVVMILSGCSLGGSSGPGGGGGLTLTSPSFGEGAMIPERHAAYGAEITPPLNWRNVPSGTRSLAIILEDPDDGAQPYVHWVVYNIPATATGLPEGLPDAAILTAPAQLAGTTIGFNNRRNATYYGPEPRRGDPAHRYQFRLYALSIEPNLEDSLNAAALRQRMQGNILAETVLTGMYQAPAQ